MPKAILDKLTAELNAVGQEPDVRKRLDTFAVEFSGLSGQAFADFARKEREALVPIVEKAGMQGAVRRSDASGTRGLRRECRNEDRSRGAVAARPARRKRLPAEQHWPPVLLVRPHI